MAYLPGFKSDVFISYPHINDWDDWVSNFHSNLEGKLSEVLGTKAFVWRDTRLRVTHDFDEEILVQVQNTGVLVAVASPSREASEWCGREFEEFQAAAERKLGFHVGTLQRAVVVAKIPSEGNSHRKILPRGLIVEFFDGEAMKFREFSQESDDYNSRLSKLAQDITAVLRELRRLLTVHLANTNEDAKLHWCKLHQELSDQNYIVRPESWIKSTSSEDKLRGWLKESGLSVHVLSSSYHEFTARQLELARKLNIPRIVWAPAGTNFQGKQTQFLEDLKQDPRGADLLDCKSLNDAIDFLLTRLHRQDKDVLQLKGLIYLACSQEDHPLVVAEENNASRIRDYLDQIGFEVDTPATGKLPVKCLRRDTSNKLAVCDGVILYWGQAEHYWLEEMRNQMRKALVNRRGRDFRSKLIYISDPKAELKARYRTHEALLVRQYGTFNQDDLQLFLDSLK